MKNIITFYLLLFCLSLTSQTDTTMALKDTLFEYQSGRDSLGLDTLITQTQQKKKLPVNLDSLWYNPLVEEKKIIDFFPRVLHRFNLAKSRFGADLGNVGSPYYEMFFEDKYRSGNHFGKGFNEVYLKNSKDLKFFNGESVYTNAFYNQENQTNSLIESDFSIRYKEGISMAMIYSLYHHNPLTRTQVNKKVLYQDINSRNSSFVLGLNYQSPRQNFLVAGFFNSKKIKQELHGGWIWSDFIENVLTYAEDSISNFATLPYFSNDLLHKIELKEKSVDFIEKWTWKPNLLVRNNYIGHHFNFSLIQNKFFNDFGGNIPTSADTSYYSSFLVEKRGLLNKWEEKQFSNRLFVNFGKFDKWEFETGFKLEQEFLLVNKLTEERNNLYIDGHGRISLGKNKHATQLVSKFELGVFEDPSYNLKNQLVGTIINMNFVLEQQYFSNRPSYYEQSLYVSDNLIWENSFNPSKHHLLKIKLALPSTRSMIQIKNERTNNRIYFNELGLARQTMKKEDVFSIMLKQDFRLGIFKSENIFVFQKTSSSLIDIPSFMGKNLLAIEGFLFKNNLLGSLGFDFQYHSDFYAPKFHSLTGQFYTNNDYLMELYPNLDAFINFKVEKFKFFFVLKNITSTWTNQVHFDIPFYPQHELSYRFGLYWGFKDQKGKGNNSTKRRK